MQVKLVTTVETIIDLDPEANPSLEEARGEILGRLSSNEEGSITEEIESAHHEAVVFDQVIAQCVTHSLVPVE